MLGQNFVSYFEPHIPYIAFYLFSAGVLFVIIERLKGVGSIFKKKVDNHWVPLVLSLVVFIFLAWWQIARHNNFFTNGLDLGLFIQSLWDVQHLRFPHSTIRGFDNLFGDHFTPIFYLLIPFAWILGADITILLLQPLAIAAGVYVVFRIFAPRFGLLSGLVMSIGYLVFFGHQLALSFDFHPIVIFSALSIYLYRELFLREDFSFRNTAIASVLSLMLQEDISLVVFYFLTIGLGYRTLRGYTFKKVLWLGNLSLLREKMFEVAKNKNVLKGLVLLFLPLVYYVSVQNFVIKPNAPGGEYLYLSHYEPLGSSAGEILIEGIKGPKKVYDQLTSPGEKVDTFLSLAETSGYLYFFDPTAYVLSAFPYTIKFLSNGRFIPYNILHYSSYYYLFSVIAVVGVFLRLQKRPKIILFLTLYLAVATYYSAFAKKEYPYQNIGIEVAHIEANRSFLEELKKIDPEATVLADNRFVPHLAQRDVVEVACHKDRPTLEAHGEYEYTISRPNHEAVLCSPEEQERYFLSDEYEVVFENEAGIIHRKKNQ